MIETTVAEIVEAYGTKSENPNTKEVLARTALHAVKATKHLPPITRRDLAFLDRELEPDVRAWEEIRKREYDDATEPMKDENGQPMFRPDERGVPQQVFYVPREKALEVEKRLADYLKKKVTLKIDRVKWPKVHDPDSKELILPEVDDMARTMPFIDYSEVE